ncbi:ABC transporter ATP-binding protein [Roseibium marinum]|uniref:Iron complex transport system ATP-binding protein n=1 Tax=Roseibium marinum TaxID=281252 RepID=A0A2S3UNN7_9HYPH|nr:ABC transporter ATP-binding protein [Roseibium marinum]POF29338.1 iron complex transport system ATP-binding protein [Roseibium marinum]
MPEFMASLSGVTAAYDGTPALGGISLDLPDNRIVAFCGPNGSGKSTALRVMRGLHKVESGEIAVAGRALADWSPKELARQVAMLSQSPQAPSDLTVEDLVMMGRFAHRGRFSGPSAEDVAACGTALRITEMTELKHRSIAQLSGGQLQRAWVAMTLAQNAPRIFLDEPTNHLDVAHAFELLDLIRHLNRAENRSFVIVLHDLNMAMRYADHVVLFKQGEVAASGPTQDVLTEDAVSSVFGISCRILPLEGLERPVIVSWGKNKA